MSRLRQDPWSEGGTEAEAPPDGTSELWGELHGKVGIWRADHVASEEVEAGGRVLTVGVRLNPKPGGPCEAI